MCKNQEQARQVLEMMDTAIEAANEMRRLLVRGKNRVYETLANDLHDLLKSIERVAPSLDMGDSGFSLMAPIVSVRASLERIRGYEDEKTALALHKIEYELVPLIEDMRLYFYYWGLVYPDESRMKKYREEDIFKYSRNIYMERAEEEGEYKYDISIAVLGYNKLAYTKLCVESILKYMPAQLRCELILINHGSDDGTKEYFDSVRPDKQLDIAVNGGGSTAHARIAEGKYILRVSNDVIVSERAIENLYYCMEADEKVAWAVPSTPNISNLQTIPMEYHGFDEFFAEAAKNNVLDPYRHEQRVRLCNPLDMRRTKVFFQIPVEGRMLPGGSFSFPDDQISLLSRRNGHKLMLVKDAYCYHFGSVTIREEGASHEQDEKYRKGCQNFLQEYGIDPWGKGCCYEYQLFRKMEFNRTGHVNILGVDCGMGSDPLKIKECLKETAHNTDVTLYNYTSDPRYEADLKGISDVVRVTLPGKCPRDVDTGIVFDYIIMESVLTGKACREHIQRYEKRLSQDGVMIAACKDPSLKRWVEQRARLLQVIESDTAGISWLCWAKERRKGQ